MARFNGAYAISDNGNSKRRCCTVDFRMVKEEISHEIFENTLINKY